MAPKSSRRATRLATILVTVVTLLAASAGIAGATGTNPFSLVRPGGVGSVSDDVEKLIERDIRPHLHTAVVVHVTAGSSDYGVSGESLMTRANLDRLTDIEPYLSGRVPFVVDRLITVNHDSITNEQNFGNEKFGFGKHYRTKNQQTYGDIAAGLHEAGKACAQRSDSICDIVLVAYAAPGVLSEERHAMAEAMKLAANGYNLHSVAVIYDHKGKSKPPSILVRQAEANAAFLNLLSALGYKAASDASGAMGAVEEILRQRFVVPDIDEAPIKPPEEIPPPTDRKMSHGDHEEMVAPEPH